MKHVNVINIIYGTCNTPGRGDTVISRAKITFERWKFLSIKKWYYQRNCARRIGRIYLSEKPAAVK